MKVTKVIAYTSLKSLKYYKKIEFNAKEYKFEKCINYLAFLNKLKSYDENTLVIIDYTALNINHDDVLTLDILSKLKNEKIEFVYVGNNEENQKFGEKIGAKRSVLSKDTLGKTLDCIYSKRLSNVEEEQCQLVEKIDEVEKDTKKENSNYKIICIGSSTGGTETVEFIIKKLPKDLQVPVVVAQHMPAVFTKMYAQRLDKTSSLKIKEAEDGEKLEKGIVYIAPGHKHMSVFKKYNGYFISCNARPEIDSINYPSADVLFESIATAFGKNAIGIILTGMGKDGAKGLLKLKEKGAFTIGQNKESCVVYGMPREAFEIGAVKVQAHINDIPELILKNI